MFETSKDVLNWVISGSVVLLTIFTTWGLYYIVMLLKKGYATVKEVSDFIGSLKEKLDRLEKLFDAIEDKIKNSASYLPLLLKGVTELLDYFKKKKDKKKTKKLSKE